MGRILIHKVRYEGDNYIFESPQLKGGVNIIEGSNGTGKSTFMNFIYYALSGSVHEFKRNNSSGSHFEITSDRNNYVELDLSINNYRYLLKRFIDSNDITVIGVEGDVEIFPIHRSKNEKNIFSDWLLDQLGITVVDVFQGVYNFKINFKDLMRLIYHDQEPNPRKIYKATDFDNIISDSELVRKIIFQLLLGKSFSDYYSSLAKQKEAEKHKQLKKALLDEYILISKNLNSNNEDLNLNFLYERYNEKSTQLKRLYSYRESLKADRPKSSNGLGNVSLIKAKILENELLLNENQKKRGDIIEELTKLHRLKENIILEVTQIKKIIHSHDKLNLFSADTCPYCLRNVDREKGKCVCGSDIDESQYERFFYNSNEYSEIFKAKQKSVETIDIAITSCSEENEKIVGLLESINEANEKLKTEIKHIVDQLDSNVDVQELNKVDDQILKIREDLASINQRIDVEKKLTELQNQFNQAENTWEEHKTRTKAFEVAANDDVRKKVLEFNEVYNTLMTNTLKNCRSARIDLEDYMPIINNGEYREASSTVPVRLMYYFSFLSLALKNIDVKFPKLLLVDTPETAGIDSENLINSISQIAIITKDYPESTYQIILSSALNKYPSEYSNKVLVTLTEDSRLLKKKSGSN